MRNEQYLLALHTAV